MNKNQILGVIGGGGSAATNKLLELVDLIYIGKGAFRDFHYPEIIAYYATQALSRSMYLEGKGKSFIQDYITIGNKLKSAGANILCISCNTAHYAIEEISFKVKLPFINLIEEVVKVTKNTKKERIGLIASNGCLIGRIYEKYFEKIYPKATIIYPDSINQELVTRAICNIKNKKRLFDKNNPERPKNIIDRVYKELIKCGAEIVIIGCTDLRVDYHNPDAIDSLEILSRSIYKVYSQSDIK